MTSRAVGGGPPNAPSSSANQDRSSASPDGSGRRRAAAPRAARVSAARTSRPGSSAEPGYPECRQIISGSLGRSALSGVSAGAGRGPSAAVCHPTSAGIFRRADRTNVPTPGRVSTKPCATSPDTTFCTVSGLTPCAATSRRLGGS